MGLSPSATGKLFLAPRFTAAGTAADPQRLEECYREMNEAREAVDQLYARWAELEAKLS